MRKISIITLIFSVIASSFAIANEVNVFNARHYKADSELYSKFTNMTGIKVNLINGKSGALEKRIISEGVDSSADLYITADAGRCGAMDAKGTLQGGLTSKAIKDATLYAAQIPLNIMVESYNSYEIIEFLAKDGNQNSLSDSGVACLCVHTAIHGAYLNVRINLKDATGGEDIMKKADKILKDSHSKKEKIMKLVEDKL